MNKIQMSVLASTVMLFTACGGGGSTTPEAVSGKFVDSAVEGLNYTCTPSGITNITDSEGIYTCNAGDTVEFSLGGYVLGSTNASSGVISPYDLTGDDTVVINIAQLLQSLDTDGDPENGITIPANIDDLDGLDVPALDSPTFDADMEEYLDLNTTLEYTWVDDVDAEDHLENSLQNIISGVWTSNLTDNELLVLIFFENGTYVHMEVDEVAPFDTENEEISGMEWGTYERDGETGQLTVAQTFDENGDTGLTDAANGLTTMFAQVSGDGLTLTAQFDDNQNGTIDEGESLDFTRAASNGLLGAWTSDLTDNDLLALVFFEDGTYVHLEVDQEAPIDQPNEDSGMEWGTYVRDDVTGELTVTQTFDANGDTGLTDAANGLTTVFVQVAGDVLTAQFDDNQNGTIEVNESLDFQRQ